MLLNRIYYIYFNNTIRFNKSLSKRNLTDYINFFIFTSIICNYTKNMTNNKNMTYIVNFYFKLKSLKMFYF